MRSEHLTRKTAIYSTKPGSIPFKRRKCNDKNGNSNELKSLDKFEQTKIAKYEISALDTEISLESDAHDSSSDTDRSARSGKKGELKDGNKGNESSSDSEIDSFLSDINTSIQQSLTQGQDLGNVRIVKNKKFELSDDDEEDASDLELNSMKQDSNKDLEEDPRAKYKRRLKLRKSYIKRFDIPTILYSDDLVSKCEGHFKIVPYILEGKIGSMYYQLAKEAFKNSKKAYLSAEEFREMDLLKFIAGFYGLKRQLVIGEEIVKRFKPMLVKNKSPTVKWWGATDFASYVLAPEVLSSLCIEEMGLLKNNDKKIGELYNKEKYLDKREKVFKIFRKTVEFGLQVSDVDPLERWEIATERELLESLNLNLDKYSSTCWQR
ncbi:hypothetical protein KAFR_0D03810 [Kazachstania africana CBS 2517]|uniref:Restriction of telomere capping protein 4 n=1 Tax=Kazachstania africana (strain ATCC 22294 / BCRC 22015 / CBS 2517 / CECT 1963 / NBRC 1671 / NRRL Y-8276) TaxID=1071382 RepID=H2AUH9_KAZAF|nr:hypothetical protein KAFR_0D03810 [Kazachstania africana CBS 2517]CCF58029.1 hypothetical protein KAFR_0D03810 [Kazachstania africana CBS 2517]